MARSSVTVNPPERLDPSGNDASNNGGNPAGNTTYNSCSGAAAWALMVIYEDPSAPPKNLVLMDGDFARAWDYLFFHSGKWYRPKVRIDHAPIRAGAKFYVFTPSGAPSGEALPSSPTCTCGCGGQYTLAHTGLLENSFFSSTYVDPPACTSDPMHRDKTNGPWYTATGALAAGVVGNDWTLFQSGPVYTEFANLYEGQNAPAADSDRAGDARERSRRVQGRLRRPSVGGQRHGDLPGARKRHVGRRGGARSVGDRSRRDHVVPVLQGRSEGRLQTAGGGERQMDPLRNTDVSERT